MPTDYWTDRLDRALIAEFGPDSNPETIWNPFAGAAGRYETHFESDDDEERARIKAFIRRFMVTALPSASLK